MSYKIHRRGHQQRAERLEVRFVPTWTGDPSQPTALPPSKPDKPNPAALSPPAPAGDPHGDPILSPVPSPPVPSASPVTPTTIPAAIPLPVTSTPVVAPPPVVSTSSSSSVVPLPVTPSSSSSVIVQTTPVVVSTASPQTSSFTTPTTFRNLPQSTFIPTTTTSASASATSSSSSGMKTGSIVGIAAASIAGVAIVGIMGIWLLKRYFTSRDEDDTHPAFQRHSWMRNSVALPDDAPSPLVHGPSVNPRPPTMIERKQTQNYSNIGRRGYPQDQGGYSQDQDGYPQVNNVGMGYTGYQDSPYGVPPMPSFDPGQHVIPSPNTAQPFFSPIGASPLPSPGVASFDETTPPIQHASFDGAAGAPVYFSRHDSNVSKAQLDSPPALPTMPNPHNNPGADGYATLSRSSVTPYQAQQYAAISRQLHDPALESVAEGPAPSVHQQSPFEDPAATSNQEEQYQELTPPSLAHSRIDSTPPMLPPMRTMSPVGAVGAQSSISQLANAFPATPKSPTFPAPVANPSSPKSPNFKQALPLSPAPGAQGHIVSVPDGVHVGQETPVQFGFNKPTAASADAKSVRRVSIAPNAKRMSVASRKSIGKPGRPETMYDEEDAYGGI